MPTRFPHIELALVVRGRPNLGRGGRESGQTKDNKKNRARHLALLQSQLSAVMASVQNATELRESQNLPSLPSATPIVIKVDPLQPIDYLRTAFELEVVSDQGDGTVIAVATPSSMTSIENKLVDFAGAAHGSGTVAKVHEIVDPGNVRRRLEELLPVELLESWPPRSDGVYVVDASFSCLGLLHVPNHPEQSAGQTDASFQRSSERWVQRQREILSEWDELKSQREAELGRFVAEYEGRLLSIVDGMSSGFFETPDSFSCRIQISGRGLHDLVVNYPYLFEIELPPDVEQPEGLRAGPDGREGAPILVAPEVGAPAVCVIDSGIQEQHPLLSAAVDATTSFSFVGPSEDVADYVGPSGHGTRVAGAVLFPVAPPTSGQQRYDVWVQNARILDAENRLPSDLFPPNVLRSIVQRFKATSRKTRIYNHSINRRGPCRVKHMSVWAAAIDGLCHEQDVLFVQSAGNIPQSNLPAARPGVLQHLVAGQVYPTYLDDASSRISDPGQSLFAITVGSISGEALEGAERNSMAGTNEPSAFTRTGMGLWGSLKPDVVEFGGDLALPAEGPPLISTPPPVCPPLVRATHIEPGGRVSRDDVGTSYAAPKVASVAAAIQSVLPGEPATLYRALVAQSARWPHWTDSVGGSEIPTVLRRMGYGVPSRERATGNSEHRITLITSGARRVSGKDCHIYRVPIPPQWRTPSVGDEFLVEVCLAYTASPRRTRQLTRGYLSTWLDWKSINIGESEDAFRARALRDSSTEDEGQNGPFNWMIGERADSGMAAGVRRKASALQKDWARIPGHQLPTALCLAVVGHHGWDPDPQAQAQYSLVVSIESLSQRVRVYESVVAQIQSEVSVRTAVRV